MHAKNIYIKVCITPPRAIISTTSMINTTEIMQKLRASDAATGQNIRFEQQVKKGKFSYITYITYMTGQLLLLYNVQ